MNLTTPTTIGELRRLVAAADHRAGAHRLWIDTSGEVHLDPLPLHGAEAGTGTGTGTGTDTAHGATARLRFTPLARGDGMLGPQAARDDRLIGELYFSILHHWLHAGDAPPGPLEVELDDFEPQRTWAAAAHTIDWRPALSACSAPR